MRNISFSLFFKVNLLLTISIFLLFLQFNNNYSVLSFLLLVAGAVSSAVILYLLLYIILFVFAPTGKFILYLSALVFIAVDIVLIVDFMIYRLYGYHINAMVLNILTSPDAMDSMQIGTAPVLMLAGVVVALVWFEFYLIKRITRATEIKNTRLNKNINRAITIPIILIVLGEKIIYGAASLLNNNDILVKFEAIPLYQPFTYNRLASKLFGFKPDVKQKSIVAKNSKVNCPIQKIDIDKNPNKFNIIIASDAAKESILSQEVSPNIEKFKKDALVFNNHRRVAEMPQDLVYSL